jgi:hypothetical protein
MRRWARRARWMVRAALTAPFVALLTAPVTAPIAAAQTASSSPASDPCLKIDNRVLGPRTSDRPLPLLSGDAAHGFHPACTVSWRALSPRNEALPVTDCFRGSLLQIPNDSACGTGTGPLWVSSRWVMTSAELVKPAARAATCQQLDTGSWAGTRAYDFDCVPQKKELKQPSDARPGAVKAAAERAPATPPAPTAAPASPPTAPMPASSSTTQDPHR